MIGVQGKIFNFINKKENTNGNNNEIPFFVQNIDKIEGRNNILGWQICEEINTLINL